MKSYKSHILCLLISVSTGSFGQNPIIRNQFSADPTARVFNGKVYVFPSHDIPTPPEKPGRKDWFCMADYYVFSSENLTDWTDHGMIVSQNKVPWVDSTTYSMWAPDCVEKNGKYYFYFPANVNQSIGKVIPTYRGVGLTSAKENIQLDRYSNLSKNRASIALLDTVNTFAGWKTILKAPSAWAHDTKVSKAQNGVHNLFVVLKDSPVEIDWIRFRN